MVWILLHVLGAMISGPEFHVNCRLQSIDLKANIAHFYLSSDDSAPHFIIPLERDVGRLGPPSHHWISYDALGNPTFIKGGYDFLNPPSGPGKPFSEKMMVKVSKRDSAEYSISLPQEKEIRTAFDASRQKRTFRLVLVSVPFQFTDFLDSTSKAKWAEREPDMVLYSKVSKWKAFGTVCSEFSLDRSATYDSTYRDLRQDSAGRDTFLVALKRISSQAYSVSTWRFIENFLGTIFSRGKYQAKYFHEGVRRILTTLDEYEQGRK